ncbi:hypothetical protein IFR05_012521 [Cadophora sp. M221]|nr:hypothetical protein IFR05_012521 [Cadophora sp. M221]
MASSRVEEEFSPINIIAITQQASVMAHKFQQLLFSDNVITSTASIAHCASPLLFTRAPAYPAFGTGN